MPRRTQRRGKAGEIADHAAAERDDEIAALDARRDDRLADLLEVAKLLRAFAGRHDDARRVAMPAAVERGFRRGEMMARRPSRR